MSFIALSKVSIMSANLVAVKSAASFFLIVVAAARSFSPVAMLPESSSVFEDEVAA